MHLLRGHGILLMLPNCFIDIHYHNFLLFLARVISGSSVAPDPNPAYDVSGSVSLAYTTVQ